MKTPTTDELKTQTIDELKAAIHKKIDAISDKRQLTKILTFIKYIKYLK